MHAGLIGMPLYESPLIEKFLTATKKIGEDTNTVFNKLDKNNDGIITFPEFKNACFQFNLGLQLEDIENLYFLLIKRTYAKQEAPLPEKPLQPRVGITYRDFAALSEKPYHLLHRSF
jgi:hypothetical protein